MSVAFVFPGQGSQQVGMGRGLADSFAVAREVFDEVGHDPASRVHALAEDPRGYHVLENLNTKPAITYLARVVHRAEPEHAGAEH